MTTTDDPEPIGTLLNHAYTYAQFGLEIFPVNPQNKSPLVSQHLATTDLDAIEAWWRQWPDALIGHRVSPFQVILDVDPRHGGRETWKKLKEEMPAFNTRTHYSGRGDGGGHIWFQRPAETLTEARLNEWARQHETGHGIDGGRWASGIDLLQYKHRYTILPPSPHVETRKPYEWGPGQSLSIDPAPMPQLLCDLLVVEESERQLPPRPPRKLDPANSIADWYTTTAKWTDLLPRHGWALVGGDGDSDGSRWRHPTANAPVSATVTHGCLFVYSPNTPFEMTSTGDKHGVTRFAGLAILEHGGDQREAARSARRLKGDKASTEKVRRIDAETGEVLAKASAEDDEAVAPNKHLQFRTLAELAADVDARPHPGWLARPVWPADSYGVIGAEQKLGKTWMVLDLIVSVASDGVWLETFPVERPGPVVVFLGEGGDRKMLRRLRAIGKAKHVKVEDLPIHLCMRVPHLTNEEHLEEMRNKIEAVKPSLVVVDPLYLAARGAKGSDLYAMGEHLEAVQHIVQTVEAALVVVHHWNKTGEGTGANRMTGAGPAEWGRVLVSASVVAKTVDPMTLATEVVVSCEFTGDEIPERTMQYKRRVWATDPNDLASPMHYAIEVVHEGDVSKYAKAEIESYKADVLALFQPGFAMTKEAVCRTAGRNRERVRLALDELVLEKKLRPVPGARRNSSNYMLSGTAQLHSVVNEDGEILNGGSNGSPTSG